MKLLFVYPSLNTISGYQTGIGYIIALLKEKGHEVQLFRVVVRNDIPRLMKKVNILKPDIIAFSSISTQFKWVSLIAAMLKTVIKSKALLICGGIHPTLEPDCLLGCSDLDGIVRGEGEYPMLELAERLDKKRQYFDIKNFYFRQNSNIIKNDLRPVIDNLDQLPFPYRTVPDYSVSEASFIFSRGCFFNCSFCCNHALKHLYKDENVRFRSSEKAVDEVEMVTKCCRNLKCIRFDDDIFTLDKLWLHRFLNLYRKKVRRKFICNARVDTVDLDTFKLLKSSGCMQVRMGIETGDERLRKEVLHKSISDAQIIKAFTWAKEAGLQTFSLNMIGLPYETPRLFQKTIHLNKILKVDIPLLYVFHPYPKTALSQLCLKEGFIKKEEMCGNFTFVERNDTILNMPRFRRKDILKYFRNFYRF
ncbi:MAG: B12-binding domain-containing radical SAM protein [Candidatus Omnitrophica bacterium]|nr:B12-binding domain-containing radical SAM protein [Candidatus Omnitrophota bacterium]